MYEIASPYFQSELNYRRDRIRSSAVPPKSRRHRFPRVRRATDPDTTTR